MSALADLRGFAPNRRAAPDFAPNLERLKSTRDAAGPLGLTLVPAEARGLDALEQAFATMIGERAQALTVLSDGGAVQLSSHSGRRSDRIEPLFAAVHESAVGTFRTCLISGLSLLSGVKRKLDHETPKGGFWRKAVVWVSVSR